MKISIIIPTYNRYKEIQRAVDSVLAQTYHNIEIVVVDDGSNDATVSLFQDSGKYAQDVRIRYTPMEKNAGVHLARNKGIDTATGEYAVLLDSDDELLPHALTTAYEIVMRDKDIDFIYAPFRIHKEQKTGFTFEKERYLTLNDFLCGKHMGAYKTGFVMVRSNIARRYRYGAPNLDFVFFRYVAKASKKIFFHPNPLGVYHTDTSGNTLTTQRRVPNIQRSINRALILETFIQDFEKDINAHCPLVLRNCAYGATLGLLLAREISRARYVAKKMIQRGAHLKHVGLFLLTFCPFASQALRRLFLLKMWIYEKSRKA